MLESVLSAFGGVGCSLIVGGVFIGWRRYNGHRDKTASHDTSIAVLQAEIRHVADKVDDIQASVDRMGSKLDDIGSQLRQGAV